MIGELEKAAINSSRDETPLWSGVDWGFHLNMGDFPNDGEIGDFIQLSSPKMILKLIAVTKAAERLSANIAEFETITDSELIDELDKALEAVK
jgi:hypothetical protein